MAMIISVMPTRTLVMTKPPTINQEMSSVRVLVGPKLFSISSLSTMTTEFASSLNLTIRMGGGPRTYPGGVSKWQWKRMQAKKAKQLLKAQLCRERQLYEMRKRAELKAAISELERPWEMVEKAPRLFSVKADEQLKVLADRFQKPGGFDMWTEKDGPRLFKTPDGLPSARFFPKDAVHSVKPYGVVVDTPESARPSTSLDKAVSNFNDWTTRDYSGNSRKSKKPVTNNLGDIVDGSTSFVNDTQASKKDGNIYLKLHHGGYENSNRKGRRSRNPVSNDLGDMVEDSRSFVNYTQAIPAKKGVTAYLNHRGGYENSNSKEFPNESSCTSNSFKQTTSRPRVGRGARWSSSGHSTQKAHSVRDYKPLTKAGLRIPHQSDPDD